MDVLTKIESGLAKRLSIIFVLMIYYQNADYKLRIYFLLRGILE